MALLCLAPASSQGGSFPGWFFRVKLDLQSSDLVYSLLQYWLCLATQYQHLFIPCRARRNAEANVPDTLFLAITAETKELCRSQQTSSSFNCHSLVIMVHRISTFGEDKFKSCPWALRETPRYASSRASALCWGYD